MHAAESSEDPNSKFIKKYKTTQIRLRTLPKAEGFRNKYIILHLVFQNKDVILNIWWWIVTHTHTRSHQTFLIFKIFSLQWKKKDCFVQYYFEWFSLQLFSTTETGIYLFEKKIQDFVNVLKGTGNQSYSKTRMYFNNNKK